MENEEYEAAAGFVEALLHLQGSVTDCGVAQEKQYAQFNHTREAVASVIRDKTNSAAVKDDVAQVDENSCNGCLLRAPLSATCLSAGTDIRETFP